MAGLSFTLGDLLEEATYRLKVIYKNAIDSSCLSIVWGHTCIFIEEQLIKGKAVTIQGLGTFTYIYKKQDLGNKGIKKTRSPLFVVADSFCQANDVKKDSFSNLTTSVPAVPLNNSLISSQSETSRDIVIDFHKEVIRCLGNAVRAKKTISIELKNIGHLVSYGSVLKATFNPDFLAQVKVVNSPAKSGTSLEDSLSDVDTMAKSTHIAPLSPPTKIKLNNFLNSPAGSRTNTPRDDFARDKVALTSRSVMLPQMDRPRNPLIKIRANSDSALRQAPFFQEDGDGKEDRENCSTGRSRISTREEEREGENEEEEEECCEHCMLAQYNARAARARREQDRAADEEVVRTQKGVLQALEDKEQLSLRLQRARREEADAFNRSTLPQKQETILKQKNADFYGDVFYARRPETPDHIKKSKYKVALEEQMVDKLQKQKQKQVEIKKEYEVFHETQKQADERARRLKLDEKQRHKDHSEYLLQQMTQKPKLKEEVAGGIGGRMERSIVPLSSLSSSLAPSLPYAEDVFRPSTADRELRRRSFDANALDHHRDTILQKKQRDDVQRSLIAREQQEVVQYNTSLQQKQQQEEINKKLQTRELLRSAWDSQLSQKRNSTLSEMTQRMAPQRTSLDLGQFAAEKQKHHCKKCGRISSLDGGNRTRFRRSSGDFRIVK